MSDGFRIRDTKNRIAFEVRPDGKTFIGDLVAGAAAASRVVLLLAMGQSNMEGRGKPYGPGLDPVNPDILMWDWASSKLKTATVPLSSQQQETGLSVATVVARETLAKEPGGTKVVIVNAGVGNTGLTNTTTTAGVWRVDYTGTHPKLFDIAMGAFDAAKAAVVDTYGVTPEVRVYWHQGEADANTADYPVALDALIDATRARVGTDAPFTLGGIVPEYITANPNRAGIRAAHVQTQSRKLLTGYADGIPNAGGAGSVTDIVHYAREGVERLGAAMYEAGRRAFTNTTSSVPATPQRVSARLVGGSLTATWSQPFSRVTAFVAEYSTDSGATWTAFPPRDPALETTATATGVTGPALVRVATTNENGTSAASTPVTAIGG